MHLDVLDLRKFYYRTPLGRVAQRAIRDQVAAFWPEAQGQTVLGFGFAVPLLRPFLEDARRVIAVMPGQQGVMPWPASSPNVSVLAHETMWPIPTGLVDKLIVLHGLETSDHPSALLQECFRVLGPGGRAIFVVPNRSGLWARRDVTPFGYGRPYSLSQIEAQLKRHKFAPERHLAALFSPPSSRRFWLRTSGMLENAGRRVSSYFAGGVILVEASKRFHSPSGLKTTSTVRGPLAILDGAGPEPVQSRTQPGLADEPMSFRGGR